MQGIDGRAVLSLILDKQARKFWIGIGLNGGCCENCYKTLSFRNNFAGNEHVFVDVNC